MGEGCAASDLVGMLVAGVGGAVPGELNGIGSGGLDGVLDVFKHAVLEQPLEGGEAVCVYYHVRERE